MAKLLKMLWEYMDLTVLPFFETWSAHIFGGWQRVCWCTNEAFNQASPTKEFWENCPQKKGGHIYGKNEGWAYLRKLLYFFRNYLGLYDLFERTCQGLTPWATIVVWTMVHRENSQFGDCPTTLNCHAINMTINATVNVTKRRIIARANMPGLTAYEILLPVYSV